MSERDEHKSTAERILDLFVFGPAGLALTAAEEFPRLAEKGRHRVEGQVHTARLVGQFAVQMGRRQIESTLGNLFSGDRQGSPGAAHPAPAQTPPSASTVEPARADTPVPPPGVSAPAGGNGALASDTLGIPGYDSLSASQVVQRLDSLSVDELEAIRQHEQAHRHRRTILNRVEQLLGVPGQGA